MATEYLNNKYLENAILNYLESRRSKAKLEMIVEDLTLSINSKAKTHHNYDYYLAELKKSKTTYEESQTNLATAFYVLSQNLARYAKDIIIDTDDTVQEGVLICLLKIDKFKPGKGKAFSYFTSVILNNSKQMYRSHKVYKLLKERYKDFLNFKMNDTIIKNGREININEDY